MKRILSILAALTLIACAALASAQTYTIGIGQFAEHGSLDNCRTGFIEGLAESGLIEGENLEIVYQNAQADMGLCQQIAQQMAQECDLVCAIATPMAQAAFNACMDSGKPVIYTAVSDPVAAMLAQGQTYENIRAQVPVSSSTITRINTELRYGSGGYRLALERLYPEQGETPPEAEE